MNTVIGIDLGTTNIVVSYAELNASQQDAQTDSITLFPIPQLVAPGQVEALPMLPATRFHYQDEFTEQQVTLPWVTDKFNQSLPKAIIGQYALELGSKVPEKLVASAKSWLGFHADSIKEIKLPNQAAEGVATVSPLEATASYLAYIKAAWDHAHPKTRFIDQQIVVTVPASFDDIARTLTIDAIKRVGIKHFQLLEEPQAACYYWLSQNNINELNAYNNMMVCDIGGGTTDFTLVKITPSKVGDAPQLERVAVGEHLMLGGDNMDLALAARVLQKLEIDASLKNLNKLIGQCQRAKEAFLSSNPPEEVRFQWQAAGSSLFGGIKETRLTAKEAEQILLEGFFPEVATDALVKTRQRSLTDVSLPFPADAAITRHCSQFIREHLGDDATHKLPDAWLLNGGPFQSETIRQVWQRQVGHWQQTAEQESLTWLSNNDPQVAVAIGATHYGVASAQKQQTIASSSVRHYFLKVAAESGDKAICILPKFTEVNSQVALHDTTFNLTLGKTVRFEVGYALSEDEYARGQTIAWNEQLHLLPALTSEVPGAGQTKVTVTALLDELGVLNLSLHEVATSQSWQLAFNLRKESNNPKQLTSTHEKLPDALNVIDNWFGAASKQAPKEPLRRTLEKLMGPRSSWSSATARTMFDKLIDLAKRRRRSPQHERSWFNIAGYCLRPGMGFAGDKERIDKVWPLYAQGLQYNQQLDVWAQWWAFWRRAAAGLSQEQQLNIYNDIQHILNANQRKQGGKPKVSAAQEEKLRLLGSLERLPLDTKTSLLHNCTNQINDKKLKTDFIWSTARLINRHLMYADESFVLQQDFVDGFLAEFEHLPPELKKEFQLIHDAASGKHKDKSNKQLWGDELPSGLSLD